MSYFSQSAYEIRLEWGIKAVEHLAEDVECIVIFDIMSFSTCVSIAAESGALLFPYPWKDSTASEYALSKNAVTANYDRRFSGEGFSLSPQTLLKLKAGDRLVLPSPNGSTVTFKAKSIVKDKSIVKEKNSQASIFCASLRNLRATARACQAFSKILIIPCGEKWADGTLRPSLEDLYAAGGLASLLEDKTLSPEAQAAAAVYRGISLEQLRDCASAQELIERGFAQDVDLCLQTDVSELACQLIDDAFIGVQEAIRD